MATERVTIEVNYNFDTGFIEWDDGGSTFVDSNNEKVHAQTVEPDNEASKIAVVELLKTGKVSPYDLMQLQKTGLI